MNDAKKKQYRQRRVHLILAGKLNKRAEDLDGCDQKSLEERARSYVRSAQAYRLAGMAAAARVQWHKAMVIHEAMENQTQAAYCRGQKKAIKLYDFEKEEE